MAVAVLRLRALRGVERASLLVQRLQAANSLLVCMLRAVAGRLDTLGRLQPFLLVHCEESVTTLLRRLIVTEIFARDRHRDGLAQLGVPAGESHDFHGTFVLRHMLAVAGVTRDRVAMDV
jgi:hypothetical protein